MRFFHPTLPMASNYMHLEVPDGDATVSLKDSALHTTVEPTTLPESTDDSATYTVAFDGGLEVDVTPGYLSAGATRYSELRSVRLTGADAAELPFVEDAETYEAFFGFSPEGDIREGGFALRVANSTGLAAGQTVDLYAQAVSLAPSVTTISRKPSGAVWELAR